MANYIPQGESRFNFDDKKDTKKAVENNQTFEKVYKKHNLKKSLIAVLIGTTVVAGSVAGMANAGVFKGPYESDIGKQIAKSSEFKEARNEYLSSNTKIKIEIPKEIKNHFRSFEDATKFLRVKTKQSFLIGQDLYVYFYGDDVYSILSLYKFHLPKDLAIDIVNS